jgi:hypothetical protein
VTSILYKLVHSDPIHPDNLEVLGLLPDKWHEVFSRVLAKSPSERYPTAAAFVQNLELCLGSWFGALEGETVILPSPCSPPRSREASSADSDETIAVHTLPPARVARRIVRPHGAHGFDPDGDCSYRRGLDGPSPRQRRTSRGRCTPGRESARGVAASVTRR